MMGSFAGLLRASTMLQLLWQHDIVSVSSPSVHVWMPCWALTVPITVGHSQHLMSGRWLEEVYYICVLVLTFKLLLYIHRLGTFGVGP